MSFTLARRPAAGLALLAALAAVCTTAATAQPAAPKPAATSHHHHSPPMHAAVTTQAASAVPVLRVNRPAPAGVRPGAVGPVPLRVPDPAVYTAQKAAADAAAVQQARRRPPPPAPAVLAPAIVRNWAGQRDTTVAPSDSTGAIGTTRYIELVNAKAAVYNRTSNTPTASAPLLQLTGCATAGCTDNVFDPQVIWDPGTNRFFYAAEENPLST